MSSVKKSKEPRANVIARLMEFEGLPNQQTVCTSGEYNLRGDDACKDVYIVHETVKEGKVRCGSEYSGSERDSESSLNGESRATDRKINHRVNIGHMPFVVDSNKEVFIEFLQNPTPLMTKHMDVLRSYDTKTRDFCNTARNVKRVSSCELKDERHGLTTWSTGTCNKQDIVECSKSWSGSEYDMLALPARIVVLDANRSVSNKQHIGEYVRPPHTYFAPDSDYETKCRWKIDGHQVGFPLRKGRKSEKTQKDYRKKIHGLRKAALDFIPKKSAGFAGDESSFYSSDDELMDMLTSRNTVYSSGWSSLSQSVDAPPSEHCDTSGKWKKTGSRKTIKLCDIQSVPDHKEEDSIRPVNSRIGQGTNMSGLQAAGGCKCPLHICKMKDEYSRDPSRPVSPRGQPAVFRVCKSSVPHKMVKDDSSMWPAETNRLCRNQTMVYTSENETSFRNENLSGNSHIRKGSNREKDDISNEGFVYQNQHISTFLNKYKANVRSSILHRLNECDHSRTAESLTPLKGVSNDDATPCHQNMLNSQEEFIQRTNNVSTPPKNEVFGSISSLSSEEANQPSPVSVPDSNADSSSSGSEYFERIFADIQGLRARLKLLKLELGAEDYKPKVTQTGEDTEKVDVSFLEVKGHLLDQILDTSYLADVFVECGFEDEDPSSILWVLPNVPPMELSVFETLEKKHSENATCPMSERRLLFDQINSGLVEIFNQYCDPCLWGKSITKTVMPFSKNALKDDLCKLLARQEEKAGVEKVRGTVPLVTFELLENIRVIGREIEDSLVAELVEELFR